MEKGFTSWLLLQAENAGGLTIHSEGKGRRLPSECINLDTSTPTGKLMLSMLAAIGQFEREMMLERQREGIRIAKDAGAYKGRKATARGKAAEVMHLLAEGLTKEATADRLGIGVASVYRIVKDSKTNAISN
jgi:DNA invertase Pin-like site-specific DNA recombinase